MLKGLSATPLFKKKRWKENKDELEFTAIFMYTHTHYVSAWLQKFGYRIYHP